MRIRSAKTSLHLHRRNPDPRARQRRALASRRPTLELLEQRDLLAVSLTQISGPSPFAECTVDGPGTNYVNAEVEPQVAVNPTDPNNIIAVFQQDRWSNGGANGLVAAVTHDGGATWHESWAHFSTCAGGTAANGGNYDRASDPWVTFAPNGDAYQISLSISADQLTSAILVSKSTDGGSTWSEPTTLIRDTAPYPDNPLNDKESITADPTNAKYVYAVWDRVRLPSDNADVNALHSSAFRGDIMFSRSTDGGVTWEPARDLFAQDKNQFAIGNQIVVLPNGTLVNVFNFSVGSGRQPSGVQTFEAVIRSTDQGQTWSKPIIIAQDQDVQVVDPDTGAPVRAGTNIPEIAVDPLDGTLYVVWADGQFSNGTHDDVVLSRSTDGGLTWSTPIKVNQSPMGVAAFTPAVHVAADGTVGVTYYDFRNNTSAPGLPTDYFLVQSQTPSDPRSWAETETRVTSTSFDMETAPVARGYFLGDYEGLTSIGSTFVPVFVQTNTGNLMNRTDVFTTTVPAGAAGAPTGDLANRTDVPNGLVIPLTLGDIATVTTLDQKMRRNGRVAGVTMSS
jgi:BNR repeat-like domain